MGGTLSASVTGPVRTEAIHIERVCGDRYEVVRPGARYAVHREGDARLGAWLPKGDPLLPGWTDVFREGEARLLLPFLRARGGAGRQAGAPTTDDGRLVARACERLGIPADRLAAAIGAQPAALSRARTGTLPAKHRAAILVLLG